MVDAYYSRKLRRHLLMSMDGELLFAHQHVADVLHWAAAHQLTKLHFADDSVTLTLSPVPQTERKENPEWQN